jgi:hypothetical protein
MSELIYLTTLFSYIGYTASNEKLRDCELLQVLTGVVVACFTILSNYLNGNTDKH